MVVISAGTWQESKGLAKPGDEDIARTEYWVPREPPKARYRIECSIDPFEGLVRGEELISLRNTTSKSISRLRILWVSFGSMEITKDNKPVIVLGETNEGAESHTVIEFAEPIRPEEKTTLQIKYNALAPDYLKSEEIRVPSFYPQVWWGYSTHNSFVVKIDAPAEYTLATSGVLDAKTGWYRAENVSRFGLFLGKGNKVIKANAEDILVQVVFKPEAEKCAHLILDTAVDVINFYRQRFGFYPYQSVSIVPGGMDWPAGGYPIATSLVGIHAMEQMDMMPEVHWRWITAHEIGHQYCGEYVLSNDPADSFDWLMIGLGIYADREYSRAKGLGSEKYQQIVARYIEGVRKGLDTTIDITLEERANIKYDFNNVVEHGKGYSVISALDCVLGKKVFDRIYKRCLKEFSGKRLDVQEFQVICEEQTGQDLGWFFDQWVNSNRYLSYEISGKKCKEEDGIYISEVEVKCLGNLKMPVPVVAYFNDGTEQRRFTERLLEASVLEFESRSPLKRALLDPDGELAMVVELSAKISALPNSEAGGKAVILFDEAKETGLSDVGAWWKLGRILYDGKYYREALEAFQITCDLGSDGSYKVFGSLVWQGHIMDLLGRRDDAVACYREALKKDNNFKIRHDNYGMIIDEKWVEERIKKPFER